MKKYKCTNTECHYSCELRSDLFPHKCVCWDYIPKWVEMDGTEPVAESNKLPKMPEWVEIGGYVYDDRNGYGKIVSGSVKSCYIEFDGGAGDFVPEAFAKLKQARLRPYNAEEMKALIGKVIVEKKSGDIGLVTGYCNRKESVYAGRNDFVADLLLSDYTIDGKPCGVLEHFENGEWVK